jgi:hypothetical protein
MNSDKERAESQRRNPSIQGLYDRAWASSLNIENERNFILRSVRFSFFVIVMVSALCALSIEAGGASRHATYGPSGHQFSIAFPSKPKSASNTSGLLDNYPKGSQAYGYWVSPGTNIFASSAPVPKAPSYIVVVGLLPSASSATSFLKQLSQIPGMKSTKVGGLSGFEFVGSEKSAINQGNTLSNPSASEGALVLRQGSTVFLIYAITTRQSVARTFLGSFKTT